jgi:ketol-acid reductoisomerase
MRLMGSDLGTIFRETMEDIQSGGFAQQFQAERAAGYPLLTQAEAMSADDSPMAQAEARVREMMGDS